MRPFWFMRLAAALRLPPLALAGLVAVLVCATTPLVAALSTPIAYERRAFEPFIPYLMSVSLVIAIPFIDTVVRWAEEALAELRPRLRVEAAAEAPAAGSMERLPDVAMRLGLGVGLLFAAIGHEVNTSRWTRFLSGDWNAFDVWLVIVGVPVGVLVFQVLAVMLVAARRLGRAADGLRLDLFVPDTGHPLARFGLALLLLNSAVTAVLLLAPAIAGVAPLGVALLSTVNNLLVSGACLVLCLGGFVRRMRALKREELARLGRAIAGEVEALADSPRAAQLAGSSFVELLAYRREVESAGTLPIDAAWAGRVLLYAVLPPLSWVAGALVEELLSSWMFG